MAEQSDLRLAFLDTVFFDSGSAIRGAILITDGETKPYEFRCTSPVRPTQLQRILYGNTLEGYVYVELIGVPLIKAAKEKPTMVLVRNPVLLRIRPHISYPVALLRIDQKSSVNEDAGGEGDHKFFTFVTHRDFPGETASIQSALAPLTQRADLLEPFERLKVALLEAHKQNVGVS